MGRVVVLGESVMIQGYTLAGAVAVAAESPDEVRRAWSCLDRDVSLVLVTRAAAAALGAAVLGGAKEPLVVEMST